jgi:hypothetical protein
LVRPAVGKSVADPSNGMAMAGPVLGVFKSDGFGPT